MSKRPVGPKSRGSSKISGTKHRPCRLTANSEAEKARPVAA
ncbi:MAG: hypothetical protein ACLUO4_05755 [Christensenellales bacterium]